MAFYKNYLILVLGILALATNVLAANIKFTAKYNEGLGGHAGSTGKNIEKSDEKGSAILQTLDNGPMVGTGLLSVRANMQRRKSSMSSLLRLQAKGQASDEVQNMIQMTNQVGLRTHTILHLNK